MIKKFVVTVCRVTKQPNHDPNNKQTGPCEWSDYCTDVTGQHHSFITEADEDDIRAYMNSEPAWRLTRLEEVTP